MKEVVTIIVNANSLINHHTVLVSDKRLIICVPRATNNALRIDTDIVDAPVRLFTKFDCYKISKYVTNFYHFHPSSRNRRLQTESLSKW